MNTPTVIFVYVDLLCMQEALTWLLENNRYYRVNAIRLNEEALNGYPKMVI